VLVLIVSLIGFSTNPSYEDFKEWFKVQSYEDVETSTEIEKTIVGFVSGIAADSSVVRDDRKVYSLYTMNSKENNYRVLGIFNNFFILEDEEVLNAVE
ncbi:MAG: hypothetical protein WBJ13_05890, partial [Sedimentibacter sp.]